MNDKRASRGPNLGLLLLIPAAVIIAKESHHRRAMMEPRCGAGSGAEGRGFGHHSPFWAGVPEGDGPGAFPLPPRIERMLAAWHTRAHEAAEPATDATA